MDLSNLIVEVRTSSLERVGAILPDDLKMDALVLQGDVGNWSCTISSKHPVAEALMAPGAGLIVTDATTGDVVFSGPALPTEINSVDSHGDTITVTGVTDEQVLEDMLAWPNPASGDLTLQTTDFDERTGPAETLMHEFVNVNIGTLAAGERRNPRVAEGEDLARGEVVTKTARFNNILGLLQDLAEPDGITFRMVQVDGKLELQTSLKPDQGRLVRLDTDSVVSSRFSRSAPSLTRALVGGRGGNASRPLHEAVSDAALEAEEDWGRRIEKFVDRQDARDLSALERVGSESLVIDGGSTQGARIEPSESLCASFGETWNLGDTVSVAAGDREHIVPVTGVILKAQNSRLRIGAILGQSDTVRARREGRKSTVVNDAAHEERLWEDDDPHTLTSGEVTAGTFTHTLAHPKVVDQSMQVTYVKPLPKENFDIADGVLTVDLFGTELAGDRFDCHYQYTPSPIVGPSVMTMDVPAHLVTDDFGATIVGGAESLATESLDTYVHLTTSSQFRLNDGSPGGFTPIALPAGSVVTGRELVCYGYRSGGTGAIPPGTISTSYETEAEFDPCLQFFYSGMSLYRNLDLPLDTPGWGSVPWPDDAAQPTHYIEGDTPPSGGYSPRFYIGPGSIFPSGELRLYYLAIRLTYTEGV